MSWSKSRSDKGRRAYHHGNLPDELVRAALELIAEKGPSGFTMAEAARAAGVSPAAPYRHFRDREDLMAEVARRGFDRLAEALETAWEDGTPNPVSAFERVGRAYLKFARENPADYAVMFEAGLPSDTSPELSRANEKAFSVLRRASEILCQEAPADQRPPALMVSLHIWSVSHGIAALFSRGDAARRKLPMAPEELLEAAILIYLRGLGIRI
ncbi:TetR/AcrR family transcriptional regulator [Rhodobium gokarnense]|uniref:AcrR family transcriptional regulator n=1 Tax=Rhodobium gokarnense TaxID=364296 RepID=A0ABT3H6K7_9HYPH|nr:TetR/AcrR family transcriptional regulator [Rhodobium gokarnense]MCW2306024.1 AcrR family transcriptional regulator [Rhodobium gokarnense]